MNIKTLIIYNDIENGLRYVILDGDFSRFNNVIVNAVNGSGFEDEFCDWFFNKETGEFSFDLSNDVSLIENKNWDKIAIATFLP